MNSKPVVSIIVLISAFCIPTADAGAIEPTRGSIRTIALAGQPNIGLPDGLTYSGEGFLGYRGVGGSSHIAFVGSFSGAPPESDRAVWLQDTTGHSRFVAREGDSAPGMPPGTFFNEDFWYLNPNSAGDVVFTGNLSGSMPGGRGIWAERNGTLNLVAGTGQPAPGLSGLQFRTVEVGLINDAGHIAVYGWAAPTGAQAKVGIWSDAGGDGLKLLAAQGIEAPHTQGGLFTGPDFPLINENGQATFLATVRRPNGQERNGIWFGHDYSDIRPLIQQGDPYPGLDQATFTFLARSPQFDADGGVLFTAIINSPATGVLSGIWRVDDTGLQQILRSDMVLRNVPGFEDRILGISNHQVSDSGAIAFAGHLDYAPGINDENNAGVWLRSPDGTVTLVAREGEMFPEASPNERLALWPEPFPTLNKLGQVAFLGYIRPHNQSHFVGSAVFAQDANGQLRTIIRSGDVIDVDNGPNVDLRTIAAVGFGGSGNTNDGWADGFNDRGEVLFDALFTDGSRGYFLSSLVAIPEPNTLVLILLGAALLTGAPLRSRTLIAEPKKAGQLCFRVRCAGMRH